MTAIIGRRGLPLGMLAAPVIVRVGSIMPVKSAADVIYMGRKFGMTTYAPPYVLQPTWKTIEEIRAAQSALLARLSA